MKRDFDIIIVGAGLTGLVAAITLGQAGFTTALIDQNDVNLPPKDYRASAIASCAERMFSRLGIDLGEHAEPIEDMVAYEGDINSPWKIHFEEPSALGIMIENKHLRQSLLMRLKGLDAVSVLSPATVLSHSHDARQVTMELSAPYGSISAKLLIAADGKSSYIRRKAGIASENNRYDQRGLVAVISHELSHDGLALQRFLRGGPIAVLPLPGNRSQIVWSDKAEAITALEQMGQGDFIEILTERIGEYLGSMRLESPLQSYPLSLQLAEQFTGERLALIGDAAHVIHPLAGQGLNLGLRDIAALADSISTAHSRGQDIGMAGLLGYDGWRNTDVRTMAAVTHGLNYMFRHKNSILGHLRRAGLSAVNDISPLKALFIHSSAGNVGDLPSLMLR